MPSKQYINNFNSGELSPYIDARADLDKYQNGCRVMENFLALPEGGAVNRAGTEFIAETKDSSKKSRMIEFQYSTDIRFMLELGDQYVRFYKDGAQLNISSAPAWVTSTAYVVGDYVTESATIYYCLVDHTSGVFATDLAAGKWVAQTIYERPMVFLEAELFEVDYQQSFDVIWFTHKNHPPQKLSRVADTNWTIEEEVWNVPALLDPNTTATTITPSATTGSITLTASASLWQSGHVGSYWEIRHPRAETEVEKLINSGGASSSLPVRGNFTFFTTGAWRATIHVERSDDGGSTWTMFRSYFSNKATNWNDQFEETEDGVTYRINIVSFLDDEPSTYPTAHLVMNEPTHKGLVKITAFTNDTSVDADVVNDLGDTTATKDWSEGAWSAVRGYPRAITLDDERLWFLGTTNDPLHIWATRIGTFDDLEVNILDDSGLSFELSSNQRNLGYWIVPKRGLVVGSAGAEWIVQSTSPTFESITNTNVRAAAATYIGSDPIKAVLVGDSVVYVQRGGRVLREFVFQIQSEGFVSSNLSRIASHITESGIVELVHQIHPFCTFWLPLTDGTLVALTYDRLENIFAFTKHTTDGSFESVGIMYGASGSDEDERWVVVKRTINGATKRYVERFHTREDADFADSFFVDSGLSFDGGAGQTIEGVTQANPAVVTITGHGLSDGTQIRITGVGGMTELNGNVYTVSNPTANDFELRNSADTADIDSTSFGAYTTGGTAEVVEDTFTNLSHLEGKAVAALVDGVPVAQETVSSGQVTLDAFGNKVHVGLPITAKLKPMKLAGRGISSSQVKIAEIILNLYRTQKAKAGPDESNLWDILYDGTGSFDGDKRVNISGSYSLSGDFIVVQDSPVPITIRSLTPVFESFG